MNLKKRKLFFLPFFLLLISWSINAQTISLKGVVNDTETAQPVDNVTVEIENTDFRTVTDNAGSFEFKDVPTGKKVLVFSKDGFTTTKLKDVNDSDQLIIVNINASNIDIKEEIVPTITLEEGDAGDEGAEDISGLLTASRDVFVSAAAFTFGPMRYRIRGYDSENTSIFMNGVPINDIENGRTYWSAWGGLNDVMRNRETDIGLGATSYGFGGVGGASSIDTRAANQRKQTRISYASSNRSYDHRIMGVHSTGMMKNGWAITISGSRRWADEGYVDGTFYDAWAYFASVDKKLNDNHSLNLTTFGAPISRGRSTSAVQEWYDIAGTNYWNPYWGFQNGEKRNSRVNTTHQPTTILRHDWKVGGDATLTTAMSYQFGRNGGTAIDWFEANDPRPDYWRKLPSFIEDPELRARVEDLLRNDEAARQLQWDELYATNLNSPITTVDNVGGVAGNTVTGKRSKYIVEERRFDSKEFNFNTVYENPIGDHLTLNFGLSYQTYLGENYKKIDDLLGGDYYLDVDRFFLEQAAIDGTPEAINNDLNNPNNAAKEGDVFGYSYDSNIRKANLWMQTNFSYRKVDFFVAANVSQNNFWRTGNFKVGKFPDNSLGDSEKQEFTNYGVKGGLTYKIDGRNYLYANAAVLTRAPTFRNSYVAPRVRDQVVENLESEEILSGEAGYILRSPYLKARASVYYTEFNNQTDLISFFNNFGQVQTFGNYVMQNIDKQHMGTELAIEARVLPGLTVNAVAAIGQHIHTSRPTAAVYQDNLATEIFSGETIFGKNFFVANGPQSAYTAGLRYRSPKFWSASINFNYFDNAWIDWNPERRTTRAVTFGTPGVGRPLEEGSDLWNSIIDQEKTDGAFTIDIFASKSWKIKKYFIYLNVGVSNILDNQNFATGGFEQLRFNFDSKDVSDFPARRFYSFGATYFISLAFKL